MPPKPAAVGSCSSWGKLYGFTFPRADPKPWRGARERPDPQGEAKGNGAAPWGCRIGRLQDRSQSEGKGSLGIGHARVGERVQQGDVSQESWASPMESIPKTSQCTLVHTLVFLAQIYQYFWFQAAGSRPSTQLPRDGADMQQRRCRQGSTITAPSRAPWSQHSMGGNHPREKG